MSSSFLRLSVQVFVSRKSANGLRLLAEKKSPWNGRQRLARPYATSTKTQDNKTLKKFDTEDESETIEKLKNVYTEEEKLGGIVPIYKKALLYGHKVAIKDQISEYTYSRLYTAAKKLSHQISNLCGSASGSRVAFLCPNDALYPIVQWACWISGQVAVPLSSRHPPELLRYFVNDSQASLIITTPVYEKSLRPLAESLNKILIIIDHSLIPEVDTSVSLLDPKNDTLATLNDKIVVEGTLDAKYYAESGAMILYTSGTTGSPKGVLMSHKNINAQVNSLSDAWHISSRDSLLHVLPLNHVHGSVNALLCPLSVGAKIIMHDRFDSHNAWSALLGINTPTKERVNLFMAVPTIYSLLIDEYDKIFAKNEKMVEYIQNHCEKNIRLMVSGSAPLPTTVFNRWFEISGHRLLERYGMTEVGMTLSNPYIEDKVRKRIPGNVGMPLPGVEVRIVDGENKTVFTSRGESNKGFWSTKNMTVSDSSSTKASAISGELQVKGSNVFQKYYNRPEETKKEFVDGYFRTGDIVAYDGVFKILGRSSVDIIKSGGYKLSALEIETHILEHPSIKDIAILGLPDEKLGQKIAAVAVLNEGTELDLPSLKEFCKQRIAPYASPTVLKIVPKLPRNPMGKVNKNDLTKQFFDDKEEEKPIIPIQT